MTQPRVGFCSKCGIVRQDGPNGLPETDCVCTAEIRHTTACRYVAAVRCPISFPCEAHVLDVCLECDACDCTSKEP